MKTICVYCGSNAGSDSAYAAQAQALLARLAADSSQTYFEHLASAALCWMVGSAVWLVWLAPRLLRR